MARREKAKEAARDGDTQSAAFIKKARELEADYESDADALMGRMAKMKPEPREKKKPPRKRDKPEDHKPGQ